MRPDRARIPELDGFRVLMILVVAWFHFWQQSWLTPYIGRYSLDFLVRAGYMMVDGTILLSGFLLYLPWARQQRDGGPSPDTRDFYERRFRRIAPSYWLYTLLMLFVVVLPYHLYTRTGDLIKDLLMHFGFIFNWTRPTYLGTQLGGGSWTIAVEMQFYVIFPLLAGLCRKHPGAVLLGMTAAAAYFRGTMVHVMTEYGMVVNQMVSFLDVYALGMALAIAYAHLEKCTFAGKRKILMQTGATLLFVLGIFCTLKILRVQASSPSYTEIQAGQMIRRPILALSLGAVLISLPFSIRPLRLLFGNPVTRFLSGISMNFYLLHQSVAVHLKRLGIPFSEFELPNQAGDRVWQMRYSMLCVGISLVLAVLVTYLVEKPCSRLLAKLFRAKKERQS